MNKIEARDPKPSHYSISSSQENLFKGTLELSCRDVTHYAGRDHFFGFGQNIKLPSGEFLKVSPKDLLYRVLITTESSDGTRQKLTAMLPSSLFIQARQDDTLCYFVETQIQVGKGETCSYFIETQKYELNIIPSTNKLSSIEEYSFDACAATVELARNNPSTDFCKFEDIPSGYLYMKGKDGVFHSCQEESNGAGVNNTIISRGEKMYSLSPYTKCIELGQIGVAKADLEKLKFVNCEAAISEFGMTQNESGITYTIEAAGNPQVEILLDKNQLFVTQEAMLCKCFDNCTALTSPNQDPKANPFCRITIDKGSKTIDESRISAKLINHGYLVIHLPFIGSSEVIDTSQAEIQYDYPVIDFDEVATIAATADSTSTCSTTIWVKAAYNVGYGNTLGVCCDPSWDKAPIELKHNGTDWSGQVPAGKDWKFVILQNGHVINWEDGQNHNCDGKASSFSINPNELNFS